MDWREMCRQQGLKRERWSLNWLSILSLPPVHCLVWLPWLSLIVWTLVTFLRKSISVSILSWQFLGYRPTHLIFFSREMGICKMKKFGTPGNDFWQNNCICFKRYSFTYIAVSYITFYIVDLNLFLNYSKRSQTLNIKLTLNRRIMSGLKKILDSSR